MRAPVPARFRSGLYPRPAHRIALHAMPLFPMEDARRGCRLKMAFGARHHSGAGVAWHLERIGCASAVLTLRPGAGQLSVFVAVRRTGIHLGAILARRGTGYCRSLRQTRSPPGKDGRDAHPLATAAKVRASANIDRHAIENPAVLVFSKGQCVTGAACETVLD